MPRLLSDNPANYSSIQRCRRKSASGTFVPVPRHPPFIGFFAEQSIREDSIAGPGAVMSQPLARIASQLGLALAVILAVVISGSTVFALRSLDSANLDTREEHLASEAPLLADQLNTFHSTLRESTQRLSGLFEKRFGAGLSVRGEQQVAVAGVQTPSLFLGNDLLNND